MSPDKFEDISHNHICIYEKNPFPTLIVINKIEELFTEKDKKGKLIFLNSQSCSCEL